MLSRSSGFQIATRWISCQTNITVRCQMFFIIYFSHRKKHWIIFSFHRQLSKISSQMLYKDDVFSSFELNLSAMRKFFSYSFLFILCSFFCSIKLIRNYCRPKCFLIFFFLKILKIPIRALELCPKVFNVSFVSIRM